MTARLIDDVGDTARWVAYHRALESERPGALFRDPYARRLAGERGRRIAEGMPALPWSYPGARGLTWGLAMRTRAYDDFILRAVEELDADAVLNLAAGLDARPYRLPLPPALTWIEADREVMLTEKRAVLDAARPACRVERVAVFADQGWKLVDTRSSIGEAFRLGRADIPNGWMLRVMMRISGRARAAIESAVRYGVLAPA